MAHKDKNKSLNKSVLLGLSFPLLLVGTVIGVLVYNKVISKH